MMIYKIIKKLAKQKDEYFKTINLLVSEGLRSDDIMLVSYPRSGNTWVRFIVANLLYGADKIESLNDLNDFVPDIYHGIKRNINYSKPRVIKTHQPFWFRHESINEKLYKKNIYIVRHPFDVLRSYYDFLISIRKKKFTFEDFVNKCVYGSFFTSWQEHVLSWYTVRNEREILFLRYEDIMNNFEISVTKLASFINKEITDDEIMYIKKISSIDNMKILEKKGSIVDINFNFIKTKQEKEKIYKELTDDMKSFVYMHYKEAMDIFKYKIN